MQRQGDLLIIKINRIPPGARKRHSLVLAEGEATGHLHRLNQGEVFAKDGQLYFQVAEHSQSILTHPEHHSITFTPGTYEVIHQREYEPGGWRHVAD